MIIEIAIVMAFLYTPIAALVLLDFAYPRPTRRMYDLYVDGKLIGQTR